MDGPDLIAGSKMEDGDKPPAVSVAAKALRQNKMHQQQRRKQLIEDLGLTPKSRHSRLAGIRTVHLPRLAAPYPPPERDIYETEEIGDIWRKYREDNEHPDTRSKTTGHWMEMEKLDKEKLPLIVEPDESVIVRDADTNEIVAVVIRKFCGNDEVLEWINGIIDENVGLRKGIRVCKLLNQLQNINVAAVA